MTHPNAYCLQNSVAFSKVDLQNLPFIAVVKHLNKTDYLLRIELLQSSSCHLTIRNYTEAISDLFHSCPSFSLIIKLCCNQRSRILGNESYCAVNQNLAFSKVTVVFI